MKNQRPKVREVMSQIVHTCQADDSLEQAAHLLWEHDCGCLPVVNADGVVSAMITDRDICMAAYSSGRSLSELRVASSMSPTLTVCGADEELTVAAQRMAEHQLRRLPVVDEAQRIQGLLSVNDMACASTSGSVTAIDDPAATESLQVLMAVCRHRGAPTSEAKLETTVVHPPARSEQPSTKKAAKGGKSRSAQHESAE